MVKAAILLKEFNDFVHEIENAAKDFNVIVMNAACRSITDLLPVGSIDAEEIGLSLIKRLRANRFHDQVQILGEAYIKAGYLTPLIWTNYAQALIERGICIAAIGLMDSLQKRNLEMSPFELAEVHGVTGRAWKDIAREAVALGRNDVAKSSLHNAYSAYERGYECDPGNPNFASWQGGQLVALSHFAKIKGIATGFANHKPLARKIAQLLLTEIGESGAISNPWFATGAAEMLFAQNDLKGCLKLLHRVVNADNAKPDAFALGSTLRNFTQIWCVDEAKGGEDIIEVLSAALAESGGGFVLTRKSARELHARIGGTAPFGKSALDHALQHARSVGMVRDGDKPLATGFVVESGSIGLDSAYGKVFVTNAHVINDSGQSSSIKANNANVQFTMRSGPAIFFRVARIIATLPLDQHDCTVVALKDGIPDDIQALEIGEMPEVMPDDPRAVVIGHPLGQEISFSFLDGTLVGFAPYNKETKGKPQVLQYRSPTDLGSSGSPVFDRYWRVIGIHRAYEPHSYHRDGRSGSFAANEGVSMQSIRDALAMLTANTKTMQKRNKARNTAK